MSHRKKEEHVREKEEENSWKILRGPDGEAWLVNMKVESSSAEEKKERHSYSLFSFVLSPTNSRKVRFSLKYRRSSWSKDDMRIPSLAHPRLTSQSCPVCLLSPVLLLSNQFIHSFTCSHPILLPDLYLFIPTLSVLDLRFSRR
jgi:hypothetical protein